MTVSTLTTYNEAAAGGTVYYFTFRCDDESWAKVYIGGVLLAAGYSVALNADQEASPGGSMTLLSAASDTVRIQRETPLTQETSYTAYDAFPSEAHELALDKAVLMAQDEAAARATADADEAAARAAADAAIIASGVEPANVGIALVTATDSTEARTVADHLSAVFRPENFGAVGDGVADDTTALQDALDAVGASGGILEVVAPHLVSDALTLTSKSGFTVRGPGLITQTADGKPIFSLTSCTDFAVEATRLYGKGSDYAGTGTDPGLSGAIGCGVYAHGCSRFAVKGNTFRNFGYAAVRIVAGHTFSVVDNHIEGTHALDAAVTPGDLYQFGILLQMTALMADSCQDFVVRGNTIWNTAMGLRVEPGAKRLTIKGNVIHDIIGQHAMYLNVQDAVVGGNQLKDIAVDYGVGIKLQSFYSATGPTTWPIKNVAVSGNSVVNALTGISVEKTGSTAPDNETVTINGNVVKGCGNLGYGIAAEDCSQLSIIGNVVQGGAYNILASLVTTGAGCSGVIRGNTCLDARWAAIYANSGETVSVVGNKILRPCLAASVVEEYHKAAIFVRGVAATDRVDVAGNTVLVDTSGGVVNGLKVYSCDLWDGGNDLDSMPRSLDTVTQTKRSLGVDFSGIENWTSIGTVAANTSVTLDITVSGIDPQDAVLYAAFEVDLDGCIVSGQVSAADTLTITLSNNAGAAKTFTDSNVYWAIQKLV